MKTKVFWYQDRHSNFGDLLGCYLYRKMTGKKCQYAVPKRTPDIVYLTAGSIIKHSRNNTIVWGSGIISRMDLIRDVKEILCVRGKYTRQRLLDLGIDCPEIFGDPALILPRLYLPKVEKKYEIGIIPHWIDFPKIKKIINKRKINEKKINKKKINEKKINKKKINEKKINKKKINQQNKKVKVINLIVKNKDSSIEKVIKEINQCQRIVSSSLHGIIVAHAYGIPAIWVKFSDKLFGDDIKFHDYYSALEMDNIKFYDFRQEIPSLSELVSIVNQSDQPNFPIITGSLYQVCPWTSK